MGRAMVSLKYGVYFRAPDTYDTINLPKMTNINKSQLHSNGLSTVVRAAANMRLWHEALALKLTVIKALCRQHAVPISGASAQFRTRWGKGWQFGRNQACVPEMASFEQETSATGMQTDIFISWIV
jgi:hypothetical protein